MGDVGWEVLVLMLGLDLTDVPHGCFANVSGTG